MKSCANFSEMKKRVGRMLYFGLLDLIDVVIEGKFLKKNMFASVNLQ